MRLCITVGVWQAVVLETALRRYEFDEGNSGILSILCFSAKGASEKLYETVKDLSLSMRSWDRYFWHRGSLSQLSNDELFSISNSDALQITELWLPKFGREEQLLAIKFRKAKVYVYEDGAFNYAQRFSCQCGMPIKTNIKRIIWRYIPRWIVKKLFNCGSFYGYLNSFMDPSYVYKGFESVCLDPNSLLDLGTPFFKSSQLPTELLDGKSILFVGQCFNSLNLMTRDEELTLYCDAISNLISTGRRIVWCEHPRNLCGYYDDLYRKLKLPLGNFLEYSKLFSGSFPLDVVLSQMNVNAIVSVSSTVLLMAKYIHGMQAFRVKVEHFKGGLVIDELDRLISSEIEPWEGSNEL